jgi:hypothetical protein
MAMDWDIAVGATVNRRREIHGGGDMPVRYGGAWFGGIEPSRVTPNVLIFSEPAKGKAHGYTFDGWTPDGVLHYTGEGPVSDQTFRSSGNRAIRDHRESHRALRVFRANSPVATYLGEFELADPPYLTTDAPGEDLSIRSVIVFRLRPVGDYDRGDLPDARVFGPAGVDDIPAEPITLVAADIEAEKNIAGSYTVEPSDEPVEYQRREAALVDRYKGWLASQGRESGRKRVRIPGEAGTLYTDLHDHEIDELIEAKASSSRVSVRAGLGQLLDYARFVKPASKALLVPSEPRPDLVELLAQHGCGVIWEDGPESGRFIHKP